MPLLDRQRSDVIPNIDNHLRKAVVFDEEDIQSVFQGELGVGISTAWLALKSAIAKSIIFSSSPEALRPRRRPNHSLFPSDTLQTRYNRPPVESNEIQSPAGRRFRLIKRIGKGGFGEVYLAEMSTPSGFTKTVAVKLLRDDIQQQQATAQRMRDEARLLGMLRHRAIVQADDLITLAGRTAVVMEFIPGVNHSWIIHPKRYEDSIPPRVILTIIGHIADALDAAYNRPSTVTGKPLQVLHRDIKPGNVRVTPDGEVKVLDFGIARSDHMDREASTTEYQLGSLPYMSPELMAGKGASTASDIYSLGVTFYESLGRRRFGWAGEDQETHNRQIDTRVEDIDWSPFEDAAAETEALLRSMIAFDPRNRPSAKEVLATTRDLEHKSPGASLEAWAPDALKRVQDPEEEKSQTGELIGQTLFEEVSTSAFDKQDLLDQLDEATMALSEQELKTKQGILSTPAQSRRKRICSRQNCSFDSPSGRRSNRLRQLLCRGSRRRATLSNQRKTRRGTSRPR